MEFAFNDEQRMIRDSADAFLSEVATSDATRTAMATELGYDPAVWHAVVNDLGWPALMVPEAYDGLGLGDVELCILQEQIGRFLLCSPFFATIALGLNTLLIAGTEAQKTYWIPRVMSGERVAVAFSGLPASEGGSHWDVDMLSAVASRQGKEWVLEGEYRYVVDGAHADLLIVAAREPVPIGEAPVRLFVLPADTAGVTRTVTPTLDQTRRWGKITLSEVTLTDEALMSDAPDAAQLLDIVLDLARIALAAEQMGGAQQCLDMAVAYAKEREQFNRPIASFQAIKHKAADMMLRTEVARSSVYYAACVAQQVRDALSNNISPDVAALREAACIAKAYCSDAFFANAAEALQIHGGVGFTWEYDVHLYFKRAKASEHYLGSPAWLRERLACQLLDGPEHRAQEAAS